MKKCQDSASCITLNISHHFQFIHIGGVDLHPYAAMHQADPFGDTGKEHRRLSSLLPISDYGNRFPFVHHGAAGGVIVNTAPQHFLLSLHAKFFRRCAGRQNDGRRSIGLLCSFDDFNRLHQPHTAHLVCHHFRTEPLCAALHFFAQAQPVDSGVEARIVFDILALYRLPADALLFQNDRVETGSCGIQCGRIPARTAADNHDIIHICHTDLPHSARAFFSEIHQFPSQRKGRSENPPQLR